MSGQYCENYDISQYCEKTMSNEKQFTVTGEMLTAVARDQNVQLKVA